MHAHLRRQEEALQWSRLGTGRSLQGGHGKRVRVAALHGTKSSGAEWM